MELPIYVIRCQNVELTDEKTGELIQGTTVHYFIFEADEQGSIPGKQFFKNRKLQLHGPMTVPAVIVSSAQGARVKLDL